ncbi:unnamed protein product [Didymodactylos carnosus]|uniref:Uncharacterized protein n=1 Tax=Didymodactylos carnosus TaxID=1234261 RepID=A0A814LAM5_9BILA|nr:unnamed protein product [Didymodactylos carnosus]CAF1063242.1 unnamed protein product [Didymodactylos carnosus]CAF3650303.1 unnamed protein product [Didymodactylos carnosus]CAF3831288.1 unnamed protein product [Didymodactylos carnosus]
MPQGKLKTKVQMPTGTKKKQPNKNSGKISKTKMNKKKKTNGNNSNAVKNRLTVEIAKNIEQECAHKVNTCEPKQLKIVNT